MEYLESQYPGGQANKEADGANSKATPEQQDNDIISMCETAPRPETKKFLDEWTTKFNAMEKS